MPASGPWGAKFALRRRILSRLSEHTGDAELALVTRVLAETTLYVTDELGLDDLFGVE